MDFKKFERINNHSRKTSEIPTLLIRKDLVDSAKSNNDVLESIQESINTPINNDTINTSMFPNFVKITLFSLYIILKLLMKMKKFIGK